MIEISNVKHYTTEELIAYIHDNNISYGLMKSLIQKNKKTLESKEFISVNYKINIAYKRIEEPLELELLLYYLVFPFGIINGFLDTRDENFLRFKKFGYLKKIKQYYLLSLMGSALYIIVAILLITLF